MDHLKPSSHLLKVRLWVKQLLVNHKIQVLQKPIEEEVDLSQTINQKAKRKLDNKQQPACANGKQGNLQQERFQPVD